MSKGFRERWRSELLNKKLAELHASMRRRLAEEGLVWPEQMEFEVWFAGLGPNHYEIAKRVFLDMVSGRYKEDRDDVEAT